MTKSQGLLLATVALSLYGIGNVWPVQVSSYRLYAYVGAPEFHQYPRMVAQHLGGHSGAGRGSVFRGGADALVATAGRSHVVALHRLFAAAGAPARDGRMVGTVDGAP